MSGYINTQILKTMRTYILFAISLNCASFIAVLAFGYPGFNPHDNFLGKLQGLLSHLDRVNFVRDLGRTHLIWITHACRTTNKSLQLP